MQKYQFFELVKIEVASLASFGTFLPVLARFWTPEKKMRYKCYRPATIGQEYK